MELDLGPDHADPLEWAKEHCKNPIRFTRGLRDERLLDFLEEASGLHTSIEIGYVVDGYTVFINKDGDCLAQYSKENLRDAMQAAKQWWEEHKHEVSPHRFKKGK